MGQGCRRSREHDNRFDLPSLQAVVPSVSDVPVQTGHLERGQNPTTPYIRQDVNGQPFNDPDGVVFRINDRGQAVGATGNCAAFTFSNLHGLHATLWQNGSVIDLGSLGGIAAPPPATGLGTRGNMAYDINRSGRVVGTSGTSDGSFRAFFWSPETLIQDVGTVHDDVASVGLSISDLGNTGAYPSRRNPFW